MDLLAITHKNICGIGECAPRTYVSNESLNSVIETLKCIDICGIINKIENKNLFDIILCILEEMENNILISDNSNVRCILEMALLDYIGKSHSIPLYDIIKMMFPDLVLNHPHPLSKTSQVLDLSISVDDFLKTRSPFYFVKVKVTSDIIFNVCRLQKLREAIGWDIPITVDSNMAWNLNEAVENIERLSKFQISYYEEPLIKGNFDSYRELKERTGAKIMLDESICNQKQLNNAIAVGACDAVNIRLSKCGGIYSSLKQIECLKKANLKYQLGAQVAECGPLVAASRHVMSMLNDYLTYEGGQQDRYFDKYIVTPMPLVNRYSNLASFIYGNGLGVELNKEFIFFNNKAITIYCI